MGLGTLILIIIAMGVYTYGAICLYKFLNDKYLMKYNETFFDMLCTSFTVSVTSLIVIFMLFQLFVCLNNVKV